MAEFRVNVILTDIEGTTTSISFVKDVLFPFAKSNTTEYLSRNWNETETVGIVERLLKLPQYEIEFMAKNEDTQSSITVEHISQFVHFLIDKDVKVEPLKTLQGLVWQKGYADGSIKGHVYPDVPLAFKRWHEKGLKLAIYSSGSVWAQKLLFGNSEAGNLQQFIEAYFDTTVGHKREKQSYINIAEKLSTVPEDILFLTDILEEAQAASSAGMKTALLKRPGNASFPHHGVAFIVVEDFDSLKISPR